MRVSEAKNERYCGRAAHVTTEGWLRRRFRIVIEGETFEEERVIQQEHVVRVECLKHGRVEGDPNLGSVMGGILLGPVGAMLGRTLDHLTGGGSEARRCTEKFVVSTVDGDWLILEGTAKDARRMGLRR